MAQTSPVYDPDEEQKKHLSAEEKAAQRWGMAPPEPSEPDEEPDDEGSEGSTARDKANKRWGMSSDELKKAEENPKSDGSSSESDPTTTENITDQVGKGFNPKDAGRFATIRGILGTSRRRGLLGGGIAAIIISIIVAGFLSLLPLKILHIVENLQNHFFSTSENAIQNETQIMLSSYIKKYVVPSLSKCSGSTIDKNCNTIVGNGNNPVINLYRAWSQAKIENKLADNYGIEIMKKGNVYYMKTPGMPNFGDGYDENGKNITPLVEDADKVDGNLFQQVGRNEVRTTINSAMEKETKWKQLMFRFKVGRFLENKYDIKRCIVACKTKDNFADWKDNKKKAAKTILVQRVLEPHAEGIGLVLECIINTSDNCLSIAKGSDGKGVNGEPLNKFEKELQEKLAALSEKYGQEAIDKLLTDAQALADKGFTQFAVEKVVSSVFTKLAGAEAGEKTAEVAGNAVPIVGTLNATANAITALRHAGQTIKYVSYAINSYGMVQLYMTYRTHADEIRAGHVDSELVGSFTDAMSRNQQKNKDGSFSGAGAEDTPLYSSLIDNNARVPDSSSPYQYKCDNGNAVSTNKIICPEENLSVSNYITEISDSLNQPPLSVFSDIGEFIHGTLGKITGLISTFFSDLISNIPGVKDLAQNVGGLLSSALQTLVKIIVPSPFSDNMSGGRTFDLVAGGADVTGNDYAHHGLGGRALTNQEYSTIVNEQNQQAQDNFSQKTFFAKMFDKNSQYSLVSKMAMAMPSNLNTAISGGLTSLLRNPFSALVKGFGSVFNFNHAMAAGNNVDMCTNGGPFGVTCYGYTDTDLPQNPQQFWDKNCVTNDFSDKWNTDSLSNINSSTAQYENKTTNPCLLIQATVGSAGGYFSDSVLTSDDLADTVDNVATGPAATGNVYWVGDSLTEGMKTSGQLGQKLASAGLNPTQIEDTVGISVGSSIPKVQADAANVKSAANVVVELGTNNCSLGSRPSCMATDAFQGQITNMVNAIRAINPTVKIYWVNIYTTKGPVYQSINDALNNLSGKLNYKVVDWAGEVKSNPGKYSFDSQLGVHLTNSNGYSNMAQFIIGALK